MGLDVRTRNLFLFIISRIALYVLITYGLCWLANDFRPVTVVGMFALYLFASYLFELFRQSMKGDSHPEKLGKWAVVTGTTSGLGKEFCVQLAERGMNLLIISRNPAKLEEQKEELEERFPQVEIRTMDFDFSRVDQNAEFYEQLDGVLGELHSDGGIGLLVNNVGVANENPLYLTEISDEDLTNMVTVNCLSTVLMSKHVVPFLQLNGKGGIIFISSGSCLSPTPMLSCYAATKAFIAHFSKSLHFEYSEGPDFPSTSSSKIFCHVITPYYFISNIYKKRSPTFTVPFPKPIVEKTLFYCAHCLSSFPYIGHALVGALTKLSGNPGKDMKAMMVRNRTRYEERLKQKEREAAREEKKE
jgi:17beta-estradiol 17-dehydrogenase / very-long-chain 3-oxoacyl-CoA reductase